VIKANVYNESPYKYLPAKMISKASEMVAKKEMDKKGEINIILCTDDFIQDLNVKYLNHNYPTDVITFELEEVPLEGEIYISVDTATEQAKEYKVSLKDELLRLAIHGTLHLAGYTDSNEELRKNMSLLEDKYLIDFKAGK
jgi:rRNA maturation RNase YbeY